MDVTHLVSISLVDMNAKPNILSETTLLKWSSTPNFGPPSVQAIVTKNSYGYASAKVNKRLPCQR
jgi:hypothetical protein